MVPEKDCFFYLFYYYFFLWYFQPPTDRLKKKDFVNVQGQKIKLSALSAIAKALEGGVI